MGVTVMFSCAGVDVARFNRFVAEELKPTYADWGKNWTIQTTGKEDPMFSPYMEDIFTRAQQDGVIPVTPGRLPELGRPFLKAVRLSR